MAEENAFTLESLSFKNGALLPYVTRTMQGDVGDLAKTRRRSCTGKAPRRKRKVLPSYPMIPMLPLKTDGIIGY